MLRNYLAAALRNLARNRLYAGVTILGLAVGFAAALLIGLYVRDELTYDQFIPGHERVYRVFQTIALPHRAPFEGQMTPMMLATPLKQEFPEVEAVARLSPSYFPPSVRRGEISGAEQNFQWGDPDFFKVVPLPAVAGDLRTALEAPDSVVLTRAMARKYFGRDAPVGQVLLVDGRPMRVSAVIQDHPSNTAFVAEFIGSSRSPLSPISQYEKINDAGSNTLLTYVRLRPGASVATMEPRLPAFLERRLPLAGSVEERFERSLALVPLTKVHLRPKALAIFGYKPQVDPAVILAIGAVGILIVVVAAINFVTLMTARAARRAVEVGVRKAAGARRRDLVVQFMGEAFVYVLLAGIIAVAMAELLLPAFSLILQRKLTFDYYSDPLLGGGYVAVLVLTGLLAGAYPALVLSRYRPAAVLKGGPLQQSGSGGLRQVLVVAQFAVLIGLVLVALTITRQTLYGLNQGLRLNKEQVVLVFSTPCREGLRDAVRRLPGVRSAGCVSSGLLNIGMNTDSVIVGGRRGDINLAPVDFGAFEVFGIKPLAGRLFDRARAADGALDSPLTNPPVVINETAARRLGFASPAAAIGKTIIWHGNWDVSMRRETAVVLPSKPSEIIGVVPDFTMGSMREVIGPTLYAVGRNLPPNSIALAIKLDGQRDAETLTEIDRLWKRYGGGAAMLRVSADFFTMRLYVDAIVQGAMVTLGAVIAVTVGALGLFALSAYTTERRTKEIGVRKAMGASSGDILKLLLWQFSKPVLLANLIAWPAAWLVMDWWLKGFVYRVDLAPWTFLAASAGALAIALATVFVHALKVARARPVSALRYE